MAQGEDGTFRSVCQQNAIKTDLFCGLRFTSGGNGIKTNLGENVETPAAGFQPAPAFAPQPCPAPERRLAHPSLDFRRNLFDDRRAGRGSRGRVG